MSNFPILRKTKQVRFSHPLAGRFYDNTKYQNFYTECTQEQPKTLRSQSLVCHPLKTEISMTNCFGMKPEVKSDALLKSSRIPKSGKRMPMQCKGRWSKGHNTSLQSISAQPLERFIMKKEAKNKAYYFQSKPIKFTDIEIKVLEPFDESRGLITEQNDQKKFKVNLQKYFQSFFKSKVPGVVSEQLAVLVEKYIGEVLKEQQKFKPKHNSHKQFDVGNKRDLQQQLLQLHSYGAQQKLKRLLRLYCIPSPQARHSFLKDLLTLIADTLHQQFKMSKQVYCLLDQSGQRITDFAQIKFSTQLLFVAQQHHVHKLIRQYFNVQQASDNKNALRKSLKEHFRQMTHRRYEETHDNVGKPLAEMKMQRRENLTRAQKIIDLKHSKHSNRTKKLQALLDKQKDNCRTSTIKKQMKIGMKQDSYVSIEQRIIIEFRRLKRINDYEVAAFSNDENNRNKVQFGIIARESPYLSCKGEQQVQRIHSALSFSQPNSSSHLDQIVTLAQYIQLRKIIACIADQQSTITFVDRYLCYDQYGQLHRQQLTQILAFVIGGRKTGEVICLTLWKWLEKNGVIVNDMLVRSNMRLVYGRNKVVYYLLVSLIFGTNEATLQDLAQEDT